MEHLAELVKIILAAPIPNLFIVIGLGLIVLGIIRRVAAYIELDTPGRLAAGVIGATLVFAGIYMQVPKETQPVTLRTLRYSMIVQKYRAGQPFQQPFKLNGRSIIFEPDDRLRFEVSSLQSGVLYIINEGPQKLNGLPQYNLMFPTPTTQGGSATLVPAQQVTIPEQSWFKFDTEQGAETIWFVWAGHTVAELEAVKSLVNVEQRGAITEPAQLTAIQQFLSKHSSSGAESAHEMGEATLIESATDPLVYAHKLQHH